MAEHVTFSPRSAFAGLAVPGRHGASAGPAGITVSERPARAMVQLVARQGHVEALRDAVAEGTGLRLPSAGEVSSTGSATAIWTGPGRWLIRDEGAAAGADPAAALAGRLADAAKGLGSVTDQTDARGVLRLSGPRTRDVLAKGLALDLHPRTFRPGMTATTLCGMVEVTLWQVDDEPAYDLAVARGYAGSFWHWLAESAAEFGLSVE